MSDHTVRNAAPEDVAGRTMVGAAWLVGWRMTTRLLGLVSTLVLARLLVPADFGLVAMATVFTASVAALSELGVSEALVRRPSNDREHLDTAFTMQVLRGCLTGGLIAAGAWGVAAWFEEPRLVPLMLVLAALAVLGGCENIGIVEYRRTLRFDMEFRLLFLPRIAGFVTTLTAAWLLRSFWALMLGIMASQLVRLAMTYAVHPFRPRAGLSRWRDLVGFSFWTWATTLPNLVWERLDAFMLGPVLGPARLGIYLLSAEIAVMPVSELVAPATHALFSGLSVAQQRGRDLVGLALGIVSAMLLVVAPLTVGISATSGYMVAGLVGPNWAAAQPVIAVFAWLCLCAPFSYVFKTVLKATGAVRPYFWAMASAAAFKFTALYAVVQAGAGLEAAAAAVVACMVIECLLFLLCLRGCGDPQWRTHLPGLLRITVSTLIVGAALQLSGLGWRPVTMASVPALLVGGAIGLATLAGSAVVQAGLWWLWRCPPGPERRVLELVAGMLSSSRFGRRGRSSVLVAGD